MMEIESSLKNIKRERPFAISSEVLKFLVEKVVIVDFKIHKQVCKLRAYSTIGAHDLPIALLLP